MAKIPFIILQFLTFNQLTVSRLGTGTHLSYLSNSSSTKNTGKRKERRRITDQVANMISILIALREGDLMPTELNSNDKNTVYLLRCCGLVLSPPQSISNITKFQRDSKTFKLGKILALCA